MKSERASALAALAAAGVDTEALCEHLGGPFARAWRRHPRRGTPGDWGVIRPVPWQPTGCFHEPGIDPASRLDYHTGCVWPQDAASQVPVVLLDPRPGEVVVDACAAPGSKSTQLGLALGEEGLLLCTDASRPRRRALAENLQRQGVVAGLVTPLSLEALARRCPAAADAVLVDAPCSGHGPGDDRAIARNARRQARLLTTAARLVRPGGRLVYSTCTPWRAENEDVITPFLAAASDWTVQAKDLPGCDGDLAGLGGLRLWPHLQGTEPFFAIRLERQGTAAPAWPRGEEPARSDPGVACPAWRLAGISLASAMAACCALPAELRGLPLGSRPHPSGWAAQALVERGRRDVVVCHDDACALWAGDERAGIGPAHGLVATTAGAPLGRLDSAGARLVLSSRHRCRPE